MNVKKDIGKVNDWLKEMKATRVIDEIETIVYAKELDEEYKPSVIKYILGRWREDIVLLEANKK